MGGETVEATVIVLVVAFVALPGWVVGLAVLVLATYFVAAEAAKRSVFRRLDL